jgi:hypothetical protein
MKVKKQHIVRGLAAAVAALAFAAPAAQADDWYAGLETAVVRPDDRADRVSPGAVETAVVRPDDRGVRVSPVSPGEPALLPDDREGVRGPGSAPQATPARIVVSPPGFVWIDAGIGAAMAFGLILLGGGMLLVARRHRKATVAEL